MSEKTSVDPLVMHIDQISDWMSVYVTFQRLESFEIIKNCVWHYPNCQNKF